MDDNNIHVWCSSETLRARKQSLYEVPQLDLGQTRNLICFSSFYALIFSNWCTFFLYTIRVRLKLVETRDFMALCVSNSHRNSSLEEIIQILVNLIYLVLLLHFARCEQYRSNSEGWSQFGFSGVRTQHNYR